MPRAVDYAKLKASPLVEVSMSVGFEEVHGLLRDQLDQLWETKFKDRLPREDQKAPYSPIVEQPSGETHSLPSASPLTNMRRWFMDEGGNHMVQVQRNWFARNWRTIGLGVVNDDPPGYPGYAGLREQFDDDLRRLTDYLSESDLGRVRVAQGEISYIHHIPASEVWEGPQDLGNVLRTFRDRTGDYLPDLEAMRIITQFVMEGEDGQMLGRLYGRVETALSAQGDPLLVVTLFARAALDPESLDGVSRFLDLGHEWITNAFPDFLTTEAMDAMS